MREMNGEICLSPLFFSGVNLKRREK